MSATSIVKPKKRITDGLHIMSEAALDPILCKKVVARTNFAWHAAFSMAFMVLTWTSDANQISEWLDNRFCLYFAPFCTATVYQDRCDLLEG